MKIITKPEEMQRISARLKRRGKSMGLVPTMGALHPGHLSLIARARRKNDVVVMTLFVNPLQFGPKEDFKKYPRPFAKDRRLAQSAGVDYIFAPRPADFVKPGQTAFIELPGISSIMCGRFRPGHFRGVATIVAKLFNACPSDRAYFGEKDYQQVRVIKKMTDDFNFPVKIVVCPTMREADGLAMSSRNNYLTHEQRARAAGVPGALIHAWRLFRFGGERNCGRLAAAAGRMLEKISDRVEYVEIRSSETLEPLKTVPRGKDGGGIIFTAVRIGTARLIDHMELR